MGHPVIFHVVERCKQIQGCNKVILATTDRNIDDTLAGLVRHSGIEVYRGNTHDVLDRYYQCAVAYGLSNIVRITGDCPLVDGTISSKIVDTFLKSNYDYVRTGSTFPDGLSTEVFSFENLERNWKQAKLRSEREHVTPYFWKNPDKFKVYSLEMDTNLSHMRLTLDYEDDLIFIRKVFQNLYRTNKYFGLANVLQLLEENRNLLQIMPKSKRYEGYNKSLMED